MERNEHELLQQLLDERAISRLLLSFSLCIDTKDFDGYAELFEEDGELVTPWGGHRGKAGLADHVRADLGHYSALHHVSTGHLIKVKDDTASVRATLLATHVIEGPEVFWSVGGYYEFEFARAADDRWLIRRVSLHPAWRFETPSH